MRLLQIGHLPARIDALRDLGLETYLFSRRHVLREVLSPFRFATEDYWRRARLRVQGIRMGAGQNLTSPRAFLTREPNAQAAIELARRLTRISQVFDTREIMSPELTKLYIQRYWKINQLPYTLLFKSDHIYVGISRDGVLKDEDVLEAARLVARLIHELNATNVLELATGRGATSSDLAREFPQVNFEGIDLSPGQLAYAWKKARALKNFHPALGDYHDLSRFENQAFDIVLINEALCYSTDKERVLREVYRVLKRGGIFVVLDAYAQKPHAELSRDELVGKQLVERGMAVPDFESHSEFLTKLPRAGFRILQDEDVTIFTSLYLAKFERLAERYFRIPVLAQSLNRFIPRELVYNSLSAWLLPVMVELGVLSYHITVAQV